MRLRSLLALSLLLLPVGCGDDVGAAASPLSCPAGLEAFRGACVEGRLRYEPSAPKDLDNVVAYGDPLTQLALPDPPKSGFRFIAPPRLMAPGEEWDGCLAWPIPEITNKVVYSARLYTTPGLHHSNVVTKPVDPESGPQPYPGCRPGEGDPFSTIGDGIPDVLFANSTQIVGTEDIVFDAGMGYRLDTTREITTSIHFLNTTTEPQVVEVAYDVFTAPETELVTEVAPFVLDIMDFTVPPHAKARVEATCPVFGGNIVTLMPHTHDLIETFSVDLLGEDGSETRVMTQDGYDTGSDIERFAPPISLEGKTDLHFACDFENPYDKAVHYGIGTDEMCILFGYVYPARQQFVGYVEREGDPCIGLQIGLLH
jgi:hypothetical protein